jgi:hypothetical protein
MGNAGGIDAQYCKLLHRADHYGYARRPRFLPTSTAQFLGQRKWKEIESRYRQRRRATTNQTGGATSLL